MLQIDIDLIYFRLKVSCNVISRSKYSYRSPNVRLKFVENAIFLCAILEKNSLHLKSWEICFDFECNVRRTLHGSLVISIPACHAEDLGLIQRFEKFLLGLLPDKKARGHLGDVKLRFKECYSCMFVYDFLVT